MSRKNLFPNLIMSPTPQEILEQSQILIPEDCRIINGIVYERCEFDGSVYRKSTFSNQEGETYYLNNDNHLYRFFMDVDDYDYVIQPELIEYLNEIFDEAA